ncbi:hypothetical protein [Streptomyces sp. NPDC008121]|uniref:hypothetical protein n=1 Tax=Streptomyces sp. NPDC008121 TaxID=3364809 RepID=UPI0036EE42CE
MSGEHARPTNTPTSTLFRSVFDAQASARGGRHGRRGTARGRLRRRLLAYRAVEFLSSHLPGDPGPGEECLLLVHGRRVIGQVHYRICANCAAGVVTALDIDRPFHSTGLGTRALSHLRSRHPDVTWRSTLTVRTTRDLLRRMRIPVTAPDDSGCHHAAVTPAPVPAG